MHSCRWGQHKQQGITSTHRNAHSTHTNRTRVDDLLLFLICGYWNGTLVVEKKNNNHSVIIIIKTKILITLRVSLRCSLYPVPASQLSWSPQSLGHRHTGPRDLQLCCSSWSVLSCKWHFLSYLLSNSVWISPVFTDTQNREHTHREPDRGFNENTVQTAIMKGSLTSITTTDN